MSIKIPLYTVKLARERFATFPSGIVEEPKATAEFFQRLIGSADREHLAALFVSTIGRPTGATIIGVGTVSQVAGHVREIFKAAILASADSIVLAHNHPEGVPFPSAADLRLTRRLITSGRILGISVTDHFIVAPSAEFSSMKADAALWGVSEAA